MQQRGLSVAVEVFEGNTADPKTRATQLTKLRQRFALKRLVLIGDRGMLTAKRIEEELRPIEGLDWITALRAPQIQKLVSDGVLNSIPPFDVTSRPTQAQQRAFDLLGVSP